MGAKFREYCAVWRRGWKFGGPDCSLQNPLNYLRPLNRHQLWLYVCAFVCYTWDAFDFMSLNMTLVAMRDTFREHQNPGLKTSTMSWGITLTLMLRPVGALIFGVLADYYGRKYCLIANITALGIAQLGTGFVQNLKQFLAVRAIFGICMGGNYGVAAATALEDLPLESYGFMGGILLQGYTVGLILASSFNLAISPHNKYGWRSLYFFGAAVTVPLVIWRLLLPETTKFTELKRRRSELKMEGDEKALSKKSLMKFVSKTWLICKNHWKMFGYLVCLNASTNFVLHGSQDIFPTYLADEVGLNRTGVTRVQNTASMGGLVGGIFAGYVSQYLGRRFCFLVPAVIGAALIPAYTLTRNRGIYAAAFFEQLCVSCAGGVTSAFLFELSPPELTVTMVGLSMHVANLVTSASSTIITKASEVYKLYKPDGTPRLDAGGQQAYDVGKVMAIFLGCAYGVEILCVSLGIENRAYQESKRGSILFKHKNEIEYFDTPEIKTQKGNDSNTLTKEKSHGSDSDSAF